MRDEVQASGKLHLATACLNREVVAVEIHLEGEARAIEAHRGTPVLEGDTELQFIVLTSDILDTCVDAETRTRDVICTLGDDLEYSTAVDTTGKAVSVGNIDVHV